jgi:hypothetical protein
MSLSINTNTILVLLFKHYFIYFPKSSFIFITNTFFHSLCLYFIDFQINRPIPSKLRCISLVSWLSVLPSDCCYCVTIQNDIWDLKQEWEEKEATLMNNDWIKKIKIEQERNLEKLKEMKNKLKEIKLDHECLSKKFHEVLSEINASQQESKKNYPINSTLLSK